MKTIRDIYNETLGAKALVEKSLYSQFGNKLIRFSDHACRYYNIVENNEEVEELLLVYVNSGMTESEIQDNVEEVEMSLDIDVSYLIYEEESDLSYVKGKIERFINR